MRIETQVKNGYKNLLDHIHQAHPDWEDIIAKSPLFAVAPLFDETNFGAESHKAFVGDVLELFDKSLDNLAFIVADNASVNKSLSDLLSVPLAIDSISRSTGTWSSTNPSSNWCIS